MQSSWTPGKVWVALRHLKFLPLRSLQNSEASQRCIWQLGTATSRWSNRSSRPRPPWMRTTTNMALASDRGFGGNPPEAWDEMLAIFFEVFHNFLEYQNIWHWYFVLFFCDQELHSISFPPTRFAFEKESFELDSFLIDGFRGNPSHFDSRHGWHGFNRTTNSMTSRHLRTSQNYNVP